VTSDPSHLRPRGNVSLSAAALHFAKRYTYMTARFAALMTAGQFSSRGRHISREIAATLGWGRFPTALPPVDIDQIASDALPIHLHSVSQSFFNTSFYELYILARITRFLQPATVFEFGTFDGRTTLNLAANVPSDAQVFTLELPPGRETFENLTRTGWRYHDSPYASRITQLLGNTLEFDYSPWASRVNLIFVDAGHAYANALNDTRAAMSMIDQSRGAIVWHDYSTHRGVQRALDELYTQGGAYRNAKWIRGTTMAVLLLGTYANLDPRPTVAAGRQGHQTVSVVQHRLKENSRPTAEL
jgi:predicted O-methyltransferase YrrM